MAYCNYLIFQKNTTFCILYTFQTGTKNSRTAQAAWRKWGGTTQYFQITDFAPTCAKPPELTAKFYRATTGQPRRWAHR